MPNFFAIDRIQFFSILFRRGMPRVLRKRRLVMQGRKLPAREFAKLMRRHRITFRALLDND